MENLVTENKGFFRSNSEFLDSNQFFYRIKSSQINVLRIFDSKVHILLVNPNFDSKIGFQLKNSNLSSSQIELENQNFDSKIENSTELFQFSSEISSRRAEFKFWLEILKK